MRRELTVNAHSTRSAPSTRRDRTEKLHQGFRKQMRDLVEAYMDWSFRIRDAGLDGTLSPDPRNASAQGTRSIKLFDIFGISSD